MTRLEESLKILSIKIYVNNLSKRTSSVSKVIQLF